MHKFSKLFELLLIIPKLGVVNVCRVIRHRCLIKLGLHPVCRIHATIDSGLFFFPPTQTLALTAPSSWQAGCKYFDWLEFPGPDQAPNWFAKVFSGGSAIADKPWWIDRGERFSGDIKEIWDLSRLAWALPFAQRATTGDVAEIRRLNLWLMDWVEKNPPYFGPNWQCGQEASIRVMHLAICAAILEQDLTPSQAVQTFVRSHMLRIAPTLGYAIAQDNNHGILEAAGLFVGGAWLYSCCGSGESLAWCQQGRKWLEDRTGRLIFPDGGFSMYSVSYHREFLDALSICEFWRRRYGLAPFSPMMNERVGAAALWLRSVVHPESGDAPNVGANDGTRLLPLTDTDYRDFRPSVQLACVLFMGVKAYPMEGVWDLPLKWLGLSLPSEILPENHSILLKDSGIAILRGNQWGSDIQAYVRFPSFRFRPSHADALHVDVWVNGSNVIRDGGSYSYAIESEFHEYFVGTESHSTVQIDSRNQMPRIGRFLFGAWLKPEYVGTLNESDESTIFEASYKDYCGGLHSRKVELGRSRLKVIDRVENFHEKAVVRWRLKPGEWRLRGNELLGDRCKISFSAGVPIVGVKLASGWESRYYFHKSRVSVLEIEIREAGVVNTEISFFA